MKGLKLDFSAGLEIKRQLALDGQKSIYMAAGG